MKFLALLAVIAPAIAEFTCIKPVNPIPAGTSGVCCEELHQDILLSFLYTGRSCKSKSNTLVWAKLTTGQGKRAELLNKADDGSTTYAPCNQGEQAACCDPVSFENIEYRRQMELMRNSCWKICI